MFACRPSGVAAAHDRAVADARPPAQLSIPRSWVAGSGEVVAELVGDDHEVPVARLLGHEGFRSAVDVAADGKE